MGPIHREGSVSELIRKRVDGPRTVTRLSRLFGSWRAQGGVGSEGHRDSVRLEVSNAIQHCSPCVPSPASPDATPDPPNLRGASNRLRPDATIQLADASHPMAAQSFLADTEIGSGEA